MGLAISQVRLLALTSRKSDIELNMQIDAKRKQTLTRKSTELAQLYYQKLQQSKIQYATSDGYEDVNYNYIMGACNGTVYNDDFLTQVAFGNGNFDQKTCNSMILTDQYGKVILNDELAQIITKVQAGFGDQKGEVQTAEAIKVLVNNNGGVKGFEAVNNILLNVEVQDPAFPADPTKKIPGATSIITKMIKNGGYQDGGTVYEVLSHPGQYVRSAELAKDATKCTQADYITLQDGYNYCVLNSSGGIVDTNTYSRMYDKSSNQFIPGTAKNDMMMLGRIVSYFGPMLSAGLKNGQTTEVKIDGVKNMLTNTMLTPPGVGAEQNILADKTAKETAEHYIGGTGGSGKYVVVNDAMGNKSVWQNIGGSVTRVTNMSAIQTSIVNNDGFVGVSDTKVLQSALHSGVYQLCMVDNMAKGRYHKNTTLDFFVQMTYVSEKLDSSTREEITAWYNSEQAKISEQETYWDEEITNLSTELSSVQTEIEAVKSLKSNAIKSVFDWGGS